MRAMVVAVALVAVNTFAEVDVPAPKVQQLPRKGILEACGGQSWKGCTQFREAALMCACTKGDNGWQVDATARAIPSVYIEKPSWLGHEMLHISDFRHFLNAHIGAMETRRFETMRDCERYTRGAMDAFGDTLQRIARISADRRDGKAIATSEDHLVVVKAEIVPKLVDDRLADLSKGVATVARNAENRPAKDRDLVGERRQHVEVAFRQSDAAIDSKELVAGGVVAKQFAVFVRRLFFDDDDDVVEQPRKLVRQLFESLFDELLELRSA